MNKTIEEALSAPGFYCISTGTGVFYVEVDNLLVCHQLQPHTFSRDGVLPREGWMNSWMMGAAMLPVVRMI